MNEYDSILKEKKVYEEQSPVKHSKFTRYVVLYFICILFILGISYLVYYHTILDAKSIFLNDIHFLKSEYQNILDPLDIENFQSNFMVEGTLKLNNQDYNYGVAKSQEKLKIDFSNQESHLFYYVDGKDRYLLLSSFADYYLKLEEPSLLNIFSNIKINFDQYVLRDDYLKKFYFEGKDPIVEVNLVIDSKMIGQIFGISSVDKNYECLITLKNNAFTNQLLSMKVVLNNDTDHTRQVLSYQGNDLFYIDNYGKTKKFFLEKKSNDFSLKIYQDDVLYSVLTGTSKENSYQYTYQVIDQIYTVNFLVSHDQSHYLYDFSSNIEINGEVYQQSFSVIFSVQKESNLEENLDEFKEYQALTEEEKSSYDAILKNLVGPLREFIDKY